MACLVPTKKAEKLWDGLCVHLPIRRGYQSGRRTLHGGALLAGGINLPEGIKPISLLIVSNVLGHKARQTELAAHKSFPIAFLLPVPTISCYLNLWFLSPSALRGRSGWAFGTIRGWHPSVPAHGAESGQGGESCGATLTRAGVGRKKFESL